MTTYEEALEAQKRALQNHVKEDVEKQKQRFPDVSNKIVSLEERRKAMTKEGYRD